MSPNKTKNNNFLTLFILLFFTVNSFAQNEFSPLSLTTEERDAIVSPAEGLMVYNKSKRCIQFYNGTSWSGCLDIASNNPEKTDPWVSSILEGSKERIATHKSPSVSGPTEVAEVTSATGRVWMDRNLGASQTGKSRRDELAYGDLYQWGRAADGHQVRSNPSTQITSTLATTDSPEHADFITTSSYPRNWQSSQNDDLWQGVNGANNPCPNGFRIPTDTELDTERLSWKTDNAAGAFDSPLKLTLAGYHSLSSAVLSTVGTNGYYWSSTVNGPYTNYLYFSNDFADITDYSRSYGYSVRCIKD